MDTFVLQVNTSTLKLQLFHSKAAVRQIEGKVMLKMETGVEKQAAAASANCWLALDPAPAAVSLSYVLKKFTSVGHKLSTPVCNIQYSTNWAKSCNSTQYQP